MSLDGFLTPADGNLYDVEASEETRGPDGGGDNDARRGRGLL